MRYTIVLLSILLAAGVAQAREGFHMGLGGGFSSLNGDDAVPVVGVSGSSPKTSQGGGGGLLLRLGYNIMGYGALEGLIQGQADSLGIDGEESWAANWRLGTRIYPHWHWQSELPDYLQPLELSMFLGWGGTYQGYDPQGIDPVAWSDGFGAFTFGTSLEYFVSDVFKVSLDYFHHSVSHDTFIYNRSDGEEYNVENVDVTMNQIFLTLLVHVS